MQETNIIIPQAPADALPRASKLFSEAWKIYQDRFKTLIIISLMPMLAFLAAGIIGGGGAALGIKLHVNSFGLGAIGIIFALAALIFLIYLGVWGTVAGIIAIKDSGEKIDWKEAYRRSKPLINVFFTTGLLAGLAVMGGLILLIVPGIIFGLWFSQSNYVVVEEGLANTAALKRSKHYVKGRLMEVIGKYVYIGLITLGLYILVGIFISLVGALSGLKQQELSWISNIFSLIWTPMVTVYGYLLYKALKQSRP